MLFVMLNVLLLMPHCMCQSNQSLRRLPSTVPKRILSEKEPHHFLAVSTTSFRINDRFQARRQAIRNFSGRHGQIASRGLFPDLNSFASTALGGLFGNSNANDLTSRQATSSQASLSSLSGDSRAVTTTHTAVPQSSPTQVPTSLAGTPKSQTPLTTSTTSSNLHATATSSHYPAATAAAQKASTSSEASSSTAEAAPRSLFQKIGALFKPTNHLQVLAILITIAIAVGLLVGLMSVLKCVAHRERFANKKDYPAGFPWVEPGTKLSGTSTRQGLVRTKSFMSTRNSMASSAHFHSGARQDTESQVNTPCSEYQLNELRTDVYADYAWTASEVDNEKNAYSPSEDGPSSASAEDSVRTPSNQEHDHWYAQSPNDGAGFVRGAKGEILEDSKVFKLGHP